MSQYSILKNEKYFEAFNRNILLSDTSHDCYEIQDGNYKPENKDDSKELFKQKKYFTYSDFNKVVQSDMGKIIAPTLEAQSVWREFDISISSIGLNKRHSLHAYVSKPVYDKPSKGTTEQFVLNFHEQFRQLDEVTPFKEHLLYAFRFTLPHTAVRSVPELWILQPMEEYMSLTQSSTGEYSLTYDKYFTMLQNACIRV